MSNNLPAFTITLPADQAEAIRKALEPRDLFAEAAEVWERAKTGNMISFRDLKILAETGKIAAVELSNGQLYYDPLVFKAVIK